MDWIFVKFLTFIQNVISWNKLKNDSKNENIVTAFPFFLNLLDIQLEKYKIAMSWKECVKTAMLLGFTKVTILGREKYNILACTNNNTDVPTVWYNGNQQVNLYKSILKHYICLLNLKKNLTKFAKIVGNSWDFLQHFWFKFPLNLQNFL